MYMANSVVEAGCSKPAVGSLHCIHWWVKSYFSHQRRLSQRPLRNSSCFQRTHCLAGEAASWLWSGVIFYPNSSLSFENIYYKTSIKWLKFQLNTRSIRYRRKRTLWWLRLGGGCSGLFTIQFSFIDTHLWLCPEILASSYVRFEKVHVTEKVAQE